MSDRQFRQLTGAAKVAIAFINAFAGIFAAYPGPELSPLWRLFAAALVGGCGAALLFLNPPGAKSRDADLSEDDLALLNAQADNLRAWRAKREAALREGER